MLASLLRRNVTAPVLLAPERPISINPLDDRDVWLRDPMFTPPADVDIVQMQKQIDSLMGTARDNESIYKLVWNGDRSYWHEYFMQWDATGRPTAEAFKRPRVRHKALRDLNGKLQRDVFPPRWLLLARVEPEQYADSWKRESYVISPELSGYYEVLDQHGRPKMERRTVYKQIRPDEPPPVFWLWFATIAAHDNFCCSTAEKSRRKCYGTYAPPQHAFELLAAQKAANDAEGTRNVYEKVSGGFISLIENEQNHYRQELYQLEVDAEILMANPMALFGVHAAEKAGLTSKDADRLAKEYIDRQKQELSRLI